MCVHRYNTCALIFCMSHKSPEARLMFPDLKAKLEFAQRHGITDAGPYSQALVRAFSAVLRGEQEDPTMDVPLEQVRADLKRMLGEPTFDSSAVDEPTAGNNLSSVLAKVQRVFAELFSD